MENLGAIALISIAVILAAPLFIKLVRKGAPNTANHPQNAREDDTRIQSSTGAGVEEHLGEAQQPLDENYALRNYPTIARGTAIKRMRAAMECVSQRGCYVFEGLIADIPYNILIDYVVVDATETTVISLRYEPGVITQPHPQAQILIDGQPLDPQPDNNRLTAIGSFSMQLGLGETTKIPSLVVFPNATTQDVDGHIPPGIAPVEEVVGLLTGHHSRTPHRGATDELAADIERAFGEHPYLTPPQEV